MRETEGYAVSAERKFAYNEFRFDSTVPGQKIFTRLYTPRGELRAVVQIVHGMAEHSALYHSFCQRLAEIGYAVVIDDHLGHGKSVASGEDYGYFFPGGIENLIQDERKLHQMTAERFPDAPYFFMGHSMGSFITRAYMARYGESLDGAILMGTASGRKPYEWAGQKALLGLLVAKHGPRYKSEKIAKMATQAYVRRFPGSPNDWVTSDPAEVERYTRDPMCGFPLSVSAYLSIGELIQEINSPLWFRQVPKDLPVLLISGQEDPVGDMGRGVRKVASLLAKTEHDTELILYPGVRHALVTEVNRKKVLEDIALFLEYKTIRAKCRKS